MADSQCNIDNSHDPFVAPFFNLDSYYDDGSAEPDSTHDSEPQTLNQPGPSSQFPWSQLHQVQAISSEAAAMSFNNDTAMMDISFEPVGGPSQPATDTGNESLHRHEQPLGTGSSDDETHHIHDRTENFDLEPRELQKRSHAKLQILPGPQQAQAFERPGIQTFDTASDSRTQFNSQGVTFDETNQGSGLLPTSIVPFNDNRINHSYDVNNSTSGNNRRQNVPVDTDFRYGAAFTDSSNFEFADLSNNAQMGSSHFEVLEQSSRAGTGLSNTDSEHLPNSMPAGLPTSGFSHQCGTQGPVSGFTSNQTTMQSSLTDSQHKHGRNPDPVQHLSTPSSFQHDRPVQNSDMSVTIRKRPSSRQPNNEQHLSTIRQTAKKTGVPESFLGMMCQNTEPQPKRRRTSSQKRNKKDVENVGGSCFLCLVIRKKCSGQRPCESCRTYWEKRVNNATAFMWTCDVYSKLTDFNMFSYSQGISYSEIVDTANSQFGGLDPFMQKFAYLFDLTDNLEPARPKAYLPKKIEESLYLYSYAYTHSIVRWKSVLVYLVPGLQRVLAFIERLYKYSCLEAFGLGDRAHRLPNKYIAALIVVLIFDEVRHLTNIEKSDPSAVDHVQLVLRNRLKVFCSQIYHSDYYKANSFKEVKRSKNEILEWLSRWTNLVPGLSCCLPPCYRKKLPRSMPDRFPVTTLDLPACLLCRPDSSDDCYDDGQTDSCCCGWAFGSTPSGFLELFGHSAQSFAGYVHSKPQSISLEGVEKGFDTRQALNEVFGGPGIDKESLCKRIAVFGGALSEILRTLFNSIGIIRESLELDLKIEIPEERLDCIAGHCRPRFFAYILRWAVTEYHAFWEKDETETQRALEILLRFSVWESNWDSSDFVSGVLLIWYNSLLAEGNLPKNHFRIHGEETKQIGQIDS